MTYVKLNGLIEEILTRYPDIDIGEFLQDNLQLPPFKAEALAARIEKQICPQTSQTPKLTRNLLQKPIDTQAPAAGCDYAVDSLSPGEFERFIRWLLETLGYCIEAESFPATSGMDLVADKDGTRVAVMARRYPRNLEVTDAIILNANDEKRIYQCSKTLVIATASFTSQAALDAQNGDIELWDLAALAEKIAQAAQNAQDNPQFSFPPFNGSLLQSLRKLGETKTFRIESRGPEKYDLYLPGVRYPLLTFQVSEGAVSSCVFRIRYNEPVVESAGEVLIGGVGDGRVEPDEADAYALIVEYLEHFIN
ncbi:MAG: restriction endonuclease [Candidatus Bathyarchaeota archaeon]|nr:restriction endonuclease [Candidatus Bathyarchaeota archaeon]